MDSTPRFFIVRNPGPSGTSTNDTQPGNQPAIVPLIPVDILPSWLRIEGYPRGLHIEQTAGMTSLGVFPPEEGHVRTRFFEHPQISGGFAAGGQHDVSSTNEAASSSSHVDDAATVDTRDSTRISEKRHEDNTSRDSAIGSRRPDKYKFDNKFNNKFNKRQKFGKHSSSRQSSLSSEFYNGDKGTFEQRNKLGLCQEWCHHGVCKRGDKCNLSHKMPQAAWELKAIGLDKIPRWWKQRYMGRGVEASHEQKNKTSHLSEVKRKAPSFMADTGHKSMADFLPREDLAPPTFDFNRKFNTQQDEELLVQY